MHGYHSGGYHDFSWTAKDTKRAIVAAMVPGAVSLISCVPYYKSSNPIEWWNSCKKPEWAPKSLYTYACVDALTIMPVGYASYIVYKYGGGLSNELTSLSLGLYASNLMLCFTSLSFMKKKNINAVYYFSISVHLTAAGSAIVACKVCLFVRLFWFLFVCLFVRLFISMFICLYIWVFTCLFVS
uniref:Bidirectional sugar transporter SWEET3-like n=1 Tax=Elaeophora elaphi TaxID=1147741 RepID=A0A0R3RKL0_9BILA